MPGGVRLYLTEDDVERVYGLPKGTNIVDLDIFDQRNTKEWALALGISTAGPNMIDLMQLKNDMRNTIDDESWVQMCILLSIGYVLDPNGSMTVMHKYLGFMRGRDAEEIRNFNWCGHMLSRVRRAILGNSDRKYVEGDVHFLICAFLDRTGVPNTPGTVSTIIPSCTLWNEKRVSGRKEAVLSTSNDLRVVPILDFPGSKTNKNKLVEERFVRKTRAKHVDSMGIAREVCSKGVQPENSDGGESEQNMKPKSLFELMSLRTDHMDTNKLLYMRKEALSFLATLRGQVTFFKRLVGVCESELISRDVTSFDDEDEAVNGSASREQTVPEFSVEGSASKIASPLAKGLAEICTSVDNPG
ncbi:unnamed protein product [Linum trigynum]|uniref:Aminotransferase-like plant mobile domain-containing protein n=1 Tax=Linum trigynum TaxID=586398 RepID=A0AAV2FGY1_9ROSI